jgi:DNA-binding NarL/FixJ family response regulator
MRVLLVDDNPDSRLLMRRVLEAKSTFEVVGEASDGVEAIELMSELKPHLVIMDVRMPRMNGIEATKEIKERWPNTAVVAFSSYDDGSAEMLAAGASAYVLKDFVSNELIMRIAESVPAT